MINMVVTGLFGQRANLVCFIPLRCQLNSTERAIPLETVNKEYLVLQHTNRQS